MKKQIQPASLPLPILILASLIFLPPALAGQPGTNARLDQLGLEDLNEITIVTAAKREQCISQVAAAASVITHEQIRRYGYRTLGEALSRVSGMTGSSDRNYSYLGVRGFSLPGDYNTRILLLVDGHRANCAMYDQASMDEGFPVDIESIERIEIVKGPGSALWGSNALFAVVNIITRQGSDMNGWRLLTELGSNRQRKGHLEYGRLFGNGLMLAGAVSGLDTDGERGVYFQEIDQPAFHNGLAQDVDGETAYKGYLNLSFKELQLHFAQSTRDKTVPSAAWDTAFNDPAAYTRDQYTMLDASIEHDIDPARNGRIFARLSHDAYEYRGDYPYHENGGWDGVRILNKDSGTDKQWGGEIRYTFTPLTGLTLITGFEYTDVYELRQHNYDAAPNYALHLDTGDADNDYNTRSVYLQGEYPLTASLRLLGGLRTDHYSTFGEQTSPRAALLYSPSLATTLKLLYGEAFRAPNDYERNYDDGIVMISNTGLKPETIKTWEVVCEQNLGRRLKLTTSLFRFELENLIGQENIGGNLQYRNNNGTIRSDGFELHLEASHDNGLTAYASLACTETKNLATDTALDNSAALQAAAGISLPLWEKRFYLSPEFLYLSHRTSSATGKRLAASTLCNLSLTSGTFLADIDLSLNIYNLFDTHILQSGGGEHYHYDPATDEDLYFDIPQPGRTIRAQFAYHF
ncbi:MAG: TonB-dependent receptor [Desulfobulbaceae bacterium]|nr:TonB-dependent receptor [Desulfobulbaceae bacterium]